MISEMQDERNEWIGRNFPNDRIEDSIFGMAEEVGELAHHFLKRSQGIRGEEEYHTTEMIDAACDCFIFSLGVFTHLGYDAEEAIRETWSRVKQRNWVDDPQKGGQ